MSLFKNKVRDVVYLPAEPARGQCYDFYKRPEAFVGILFVHYDGKCECSSECQDRRNAKTLGLLHTAAVIVVVNVLAE